MIVLVCGGRDFLRDDHVDAALDQIHARTPIALVIQGGAMGADTLARWWAKSRCVAWQTFEALGGLKVEATAREHFEILWDQINGKRAPWSSNPWVWRVEFRGLP